MTPERFGALADAYGGDIDRWPLAERDAARSYLHARPEACAVLALAAGLDAALATWTIEGPRAALAARIVSATTRRHDKTRRLRLWLSSLGAATALASGLAAGALVVTLSTPAAEPEMTAPLYELSVLGAPLEVEAEPTTPGHS